MSDIIANAKQLLDGATPGPWHVDNSDPDWAQLVGPVRLDRNLITQDVLADVFDGISDTDLDLAVSAPELAQALAEEIYEYQVQARSMKRPAWEPSTNDILQKWYSAEDIEGAKDKARAYTPYFHGRENVEIRVLRRRVSPPEVINE